MKLSKSCVPSLFLGSLIALTALPGWAQTSTPATGPSALATAGVIAQTAAVANQKAVPCNDIAMVFRTSPNAAEKASAKVGNAGITGKAS